MNTLSFRNTESCSGTSWIPDAKIRFQSAAHLRLNARSRRVTIDSATDFLCRKRFSNVTGTEQYKAQGESDPEVAG